MKQYESYKDSGIDWLGKIPSHWISSKLKHHTSIVLGKMLMSNPPIGQEHLYTYEKYLKSRNIGWLELFLQEGEVEHMWFNDSEKNMYELKANDIVMNEGGDIGKVALWKEQPFKCYIQNSVNKITSKEDIHPSFLQFLLYSIAQTNYFWSVANPVSIAHLTKEKLSETPIIIPPKTEQIIIASYLDYKVGQIDGAIKEKEAMLEDLKSYRTAIISEAVTKGLDKNVSLKNSGVPSIGFIPKDWKCLPIKYVLEQTKDGIKIGPFGSTLTGKVSPDNDVKVYGQWNVVDQDFTAGNNFVSEETYNELSSYWIHPGDILISMMGTVGKCAIIPEDVPNGIMDSHIVKIRLDESVILPQFFYYVYDKDCSQVVIEQIQKNRRGSIMDGLNSTLIKNFIIPLPNIVDQQIIVSFLDHKVGQIDNSIKEIRFQIADLKSYKSSVISEAVTGKVDLRDWKCKTANA